jgi:hypothetical protein
MKPFGIADIRSGNLEAYGATYISHLSEVNNLVRNFSGLKTALNASDLAGAEDLIRASVVLSDLTTLTLQGGEVLNITFPRGKTFNVAFPREFKEKYKLGPAGPAIGLGLVQPIDKQHVSFVKSCLPLIEQGRLLLRPPRIALVRTGERHWRTFEVEPDAKDDTWIVSRETQSMGTIPVKVETEGRIPFDLALPYLHRVPYADLARILEDAGDTVLNLRRGIRKALAERSTADPEATAEFRRDVIDPELEALERAFKKAVASHRYKIGGAVVGVVGLSLSALITGGTTAVVSGLLGAGGFGLVAKEYGAFRSKLEEMKDHPFYLFWRAKYRR